MQKEDEKLYYFKYKTITIDQLTKMAGHLEYDELAVMIIKYVDDKILEPLISSGKNGRRPALYNKYRILKPENDYSDAINEIKMLHPYFKHSKYANHPEMYIKHKREIDLLSKFLWENENSLQDTMSINERSFQIWGKEKLLKDTSTIKSIFAYNEWDLSLLNYYETPEPFFEFIYSNAEIMNILIIENKDTWFGLRRIMQEDKLNYLFRDYHVLLYGEGKKIISRSDRLKEYDSMLKGSSNRYYYFGDLDYEGIEIFQTLASNNEELFISLCTELYSWMLKESDRYELPKTKAGQKKVHIELFLKYFAKDDARKIQEILGNGLYIPQEILNHSLLRSEMIDRKV